MKLHVKISSIQKFYIHTYSENSLRGGYMQRGKVCEKNGSMERSNNKSQKFPINAKGWFLTVASQELREIKKLIKIHKVISWHTFMLLVVAGWCFFFFWVWRTKKWVWTEERYLDDIIKDWNSSTVYPSQKKTSRYFQPLHPNIFQG